MGSPDSALSETALNSDLRRQLNRRQQEHERNLAAALAAKDLREQRAAQAAARRNERSIALLVSKLLCDHDLRFTKFTAGGAMAIAMTCRHCKATCSRNTR